MMAPDPNIILIVMDAVRPDHLGCYGYERATTPNLDRFAEQATIYENAYAPGIWTIPAMTSIFTGLYPVEHGVNDIYTAPSPGTITLMKRLRATGYVIAGFTASPWMRLFGSDFDSSQLVARLFETSDPNRIHRVLERAYKILWRREDKGAREMNQTAIRWLSRRRQGDPPFMAYLHYMEAHGPYWPPRQVRNEWRRTSLSERRLRDLARVEMPFLLGRMEMTEADWVALIDLYDAGIAYLDKQLGVLFEFLERSRLLDNTLVCILADHGENLGENALIGHQYGVNDALLRVPLFIRFPHHFRAGHRLSQPVQTSDLMATIAELIGQTDNWRVSAGLRWKSLMPHRLDDNEYTYAQYVQPQIERFRRRYPEFNTAAYEREYWSIRDSSHKLILDSQGNVRLYAFREDPEEAYDLAASDSSTRDRLQQALKRWLELAVESRLRTQALDHDPALVAHLEALGYL